MSVIKRMGPRVVLSLSIIVTIFAYYANITTLNNFVKTIMDYAVIIVAFSIPIGAINILKINYKIITQRKENDWYLSIILILCFLVMGSLGIYSGAMDSTYNWLYQYVSVPAGSAIYAMTGFYVATAAYRAFRVRTADAALLLGCGALVMLKNAPIGGVIWSGFNVIGQWLEDYAQTTGWRAVWICVGIGFISLSIRYIFGKERSLLGGA